MTKDEFVSLQLQYHQSGKSLKQFLCDTGIFYSNVSISHLFLCCAERSNFSTSVNVEAYPPKSVLPRTRAKEPGTLASVLGRTDLKDAENHTDMKTVYINPNRSLDC